MTSGVKSRVRAKRVKDDEFFTLAEDVKLELDNWWPELAGKSVHLPCDSAEHSEIWRYLVDNFHQIGLERLTATCFARVGSGRLSEYTAARGRQDRELEWNGDFQSHEVIGIMAQHDLVITNPPFSLARKFIQQLRELRIDYLFLWTLTGVTNCKFPRDLYMRGLLDFGYSGRDISTQFGRPDGSRKAVPHPRWVQNMKFDIPRPPLELTMDYDPAIHRPFDNVRNIIYCPKVSQIPCDYGGLLAAPPTVLDFDYREHFDLMCIADSVKHVAEAGLVDWNKYVNIRGAVQRPDSNIIMNPSKLAQDGEVIGNWVPVMQPVTHPAKLNQDGRQPPESYVAVMRPDKLNQDGRQPMDDVAVLARKPDGSSTMAIIQPK